ncbi:hypothetical protein JCM10908_001441 [Rhodotorula pacifica]|uniref:Spc98p n=1 Tax=Rhodotorula pacifica TaxID=1495444 RepID=UPI00317385B4
MARPAVYDNASGVSGAHAGAFEVLFYAGFSLFRLGAVKDVFCSFLLQLVTDFYLGSSIVLAKAVAHGSAAGQSLRYASQPNFFRPPEEALVRSTSTSNSPPASRTARKHSKVSMAQLLEQHRTTTTILSDCAESLAPPLDEATLLRDVLFILQGLDGQYVRFRPEKPPSLGPRRTFVHGDIVAEGGAVTDELPEHLAGASEPPPAYVGGIDFTLEGSGHSISAPTRALVHTLSELGWLYRTIERRLQDEPQPEEIVPLPSARRAKGKPRKGMVEQSLYAELLKETSDYFTLVASLEARLEGVEDPSGRSHPDTAEGSPFDDSDGLTLRKLEVRTRPVRLRLRLMGALAADIGGAHTGGAFLSTLHAYTSNGDPFLATCSSRLLQTLSAPFFAILSRWIYTGELHDPYDEFFVALNPALEETTRQARLTEAYADRSTESGMPSHELWAQKFVFRQEMLPTFLEESFGRKIFSTGKSLNFMKYSCDDDSWVTLRNVHDSPVLHYADMRELERSIALAYSQASARLFELFFERFQLLEHLRALKDFVMLGKGDFVEILMEQLGPSLHRPANTLYRHNLTSTLETAIRGSTQATEALDNILGRLDARMLDFEQGQVGWDVFLLEYKVDAPISTVIDPASLDGYRSMFKHLWEIKRVEYALNECWRTLMTKTRLLKRGSALAFALHQTRIALGDMIFFVRQVEYYCHLEVVACQWKELEDFVAKKDGDLDKLMEAHRRYITTLVDKALLRAAGRRKKEVKPLIDQLRDIFKVMLQHKNVADDLFAYAMQYESYARSTAASSAGRGLPPILARAPTTEQLESLEDRLAQYGGLFREQAKEFVASLERSTDLDMRFLAVRLNFNYQFRPDPTSAKSEA